MELSGQEDGLRWIPGRVGSIVVPGGRESRGLSKRRRRMILPRAGPRVPRESWRWEM